MMRVGDPAAPDGRSGRLENRAEPLPAKEYLAANQRK